VSRVSSAGGAEIDRAARIYDLDEGAAMVERLSLGVVAVLLVATMVLAGKQSTPTVDTAGASIAPGVKGAWKVTEQWTRSGGGEWTAGVPPHLSIYIFTDKHYSYMFSPGRGPRPSFAGDPNRPTAAEKVAAYDSIVAASGTYALTGSTLILNAILHKNPSEMTGHALKYTVELDDDTLRMTVDNPPFAPGVQRRTVLARIE
jgi:hypothetical protein